MNAEQIRQKAEKYAINGNTRGSLSLEILFQNTRDAFIAGAHSRDEEITRLSAEIEDDNYVISKLREELNKLRNPWISVEDRLPKENCVVFVSLGETEYLSAHYRAKSKRFITVSKDKQTLVEVRKSSATYTTCGDCIKEERLYSEGQREDVTSLVTHWMPIPEIKKGE